MGKIAAQNKFEVPENVELKTDADYTKYETAVVEAAQWLETTNLNVEPEKRKQVSTFLIQWITGSPTVTVELNDEIGKLYGENEKLLMIYLASYTRNYIENKGTATQFTATKAALQSMMVVYKKGVDIIKNDDMKKLLSYTDAQLDHFITQKLIKN